MKRITFLLSVCWVVGAAMPLMNLAADSAREPVDYEQPKLLKGTVYEKGTRKVLFTSTRTATRTGDKVHVLCDYNYPDGKLAARERIVFTAGKLASFQLDLLQTDAHGSTLVEPDPKHPGKDKLLFDYTTAGKKKTDSESPQNETLVGDMIPYFITAHWNELLAGKPAPFRFVASDRLETVGFKLVKDSESTRDGKPVVRFKMEPTSIIIAQLVDPIFFLVEKGGAHHLLEYDGRTTPLIKSGNKWKDLDALTVYDWK